MKLSKSLTGSVNALSGLVLLALMVVGVIAFLGDSVSVSNFACLAFITTALMLVAAYFIWLKVILYFLPEWIVRRLSAGPAISALGINDYTIKKARPVFEERSKRQKTGGRVTPGVGYKVRLLNLYLINLR